MMEQLEIWKWFCYIQMTKVKKNYILYKELAETKECYAANLTKEEVFKLQSMLDTVLQKGN